MRIIKGVGQVVCFIIVLILCFQSFAMGEYKKHKILFFNSESSDVYWWKTAAEIMDAACNDLDMELQVIQVNRNRIAMKQEFKCIATSEKRPDAVVFQNMKMNAVDMLRIAEENKIPAFIFNAGLLDEQREKCGGPREKFKYWVGQMVPDDAGAGYDLAQMLYKEAKQLGLEDEAGRVHCIAINGNKSDKAAVERMKGLTKAVDENQLFVLHHISNGQWEQKSGKKLFRGMYKRFSQVKVVWVANDPMAMGVLQAMDEAGIVPGKDMIVGSIDWHPEALEAVLQKRLVVTINGHFMETAWVTVLLYDYFHGRDFYEERLEFKSVMESLTQENIEAYLKYFITENFNKVDFSRFSKIKNPDILKYDFKFEPLLKQMQIQ